MELDNFLNQLNTDPKSIDFTDTISVIDSKYDYTPAAFNNGSILNDAGQNEGSCKIFAFAQLNNLSKAQTLFCFGKYYREDVLKDPEGNGHQNIRQFMLNGWHGIKFDSEPLIERNLILN